MRDAQVGYVVVATRRASPELVEFAIRILDLELIAESDTRTLFRPHQSALPDWTATAAVLPAGR